MSNTSSLTALFVGSFDPFTIGHADIVARALNIFPRLVIGVGVNPEKHCMFTPEERVEAIRRLYEGDDRISVTGYTDFAIDLAHRVKATCLVKGVRTVADFEYEQVEATFNRKMGGIETLLLYAKPEFSAISSTAYRQLVHFHKDAAWMLPKKEERKEGKE